MAATSLGKHRIRVLSVVVATATGAGAREDRSARRLSEHTLSPHPCTLTLIYALLALTGSQHGHLISPRHDGAIPNKSGARGGGVSASHKSLASVRGDASSKYMFYCRISRCYKQNKIITFQIYMMHSSSCSFLQDFHDNTKSYFWKPSEAILDGL